MIHLIYFVTGFIFGFIVTYLYVAQTITWKLKETRSKLIYRDGKITAEAFLEEYFNKRIVDYIYKGV